MEYLKFLLTALLIIQPVAANSKTQATLPANTEYAGYFDFDFDKTPESFYYADGTFYVTNDNGEEIGSFKPKYEKIFDLSATVYENETDSFYTAVTFGDYYNHSQYEITIKNDKLEATENEPPEKRSEMVWMANLQGLPEFKGKKVFQVYYFGDALMNTPVEFENGTAKANYDYFEIETYRNAGGTDDRALFADVINGKPVMVEILPDNAYYNGVNITPKDYLTNGIPAFFRVDNQITTGFISSQGGVFIFRLSEEGITVSEMSDFGNDLCRPDPERNEYFVTDGGNQDMGFMNVGYGGRVYKDYCFFKTADGSYREYGGLEMPIADFLKIDGMIEFITPYLEKDNEDYNTIIRDVQWRANNTFTVNLIAIYRDYPEYSRQVYFIFRYENGEFTPIQENDGYFYPSVSAYREDVAVYPESLPEFQTNQ
jgi:hypothetical protein